MQVDLRRVEESDIEVFFGHWADDAALEMAAFTPVDARDRAAFEKRWARHRGDDSILTRTIQCDDQAVGWISSWDNDGDREVTYWIGRGHWGKGIASEALRLFLSLETTRPLHAAVAADNVGSRRVLEKAGFRVTGTAQAYANARAAEVAELLLRLDT